MFIITAKLDKRKLTAVVVAAGVLLCAVIILLSGRDARSVSASPRPSGKNVSANEDRVAFLSEYGWTVDEQPVEFEEVLIPGQFDGVFAGYNDIQKTQGYDFTKYRGKRVMRYSYNITNYPNVSENVRATLFIYKNTVIGGDVASVSLDGFMHGFQKA